MKLVIFAGPPTCGKTTVIKQVIKRMLVKNYKPAYIKIDVLYDKFVENIEPKNIQQKYNINKQTYYNFIKDFEFNTNHLTDEYNLFVSEKDKNIFGDTE